MYKQLIFQLESYLLVGFLRCIGVHSLFSVSCEKLAEALMAADAGIYEGPCE